MKKETLDKALTYGGSKPPEEIATDENLALLALDSQMWAEAAEEDDYTMTPDKLAVKLPGMAVASSQLPDQTYARFRPEDEEILAAEQAAFKEADSE